MKSEHSVLNLKTQISGLFASVYSSLAVRIEVCSYELHICSVNKETRVRYCTLTVKLFHRYRIGTSNFYITVRSTKVFGNPPPPNLYYSYALPLNLLKLSLVNKIIASTSFIPLLFLFNAKQGILFDLGYLIQKSFCFLRVFESLTETSI